MRKIVIVDDDRQVLQGMQHTIPWRELALELVGEAMDGEEGLRLVRELQPDIVITDIYMPVMNGLDMIEQLHCNNFQGKIIILSGYSDFEYARQALRLNVDDYLSKPVTLQTIREVIQRAIIELEERELQKRDEQGLKEKLMVYEPFVENEWIKSAITGCWIGEEIKRLPIGNKWGWETSHFLVMAIEVMRNEPMKGWLSRDWNLIRFATGNIIKEHADELRVNARFHELHSHQMAVLLQINREASEERFHRLALQLSRHVVESVENFLRIKLQIGIGTRKTEWRRISDSTEEAFQALADKKSKLDAVLPIYTAKPEEVSSQLPFNLRPVRFYQEMADAVRHLSEQEAYEALKRFFSDLNGRNGIAAVELQHIGRELWAIFSVTLYESGIILEADFTETDIQRDLQSIVLPDQFKSWVMKKVQEICSRYTRNENLKHKQAVDFMIQYIHEYYAEEIRLGDLAEKVFISRNYLSNIFREATGETFNDYVTRVRMEKAKRLVLDGKLMVFEIAEKVGYRNVPYFTTLFKKHTGRSPSDFFKR